MPLLLRETGETWAHSKSFRHGTYEDIWRTCTKGYKSKTEYILYYIYYIILNIYTFKIFLKYSSRIVNVLICDSKSAAWNSSAGRFSISRNQALVALLLCRWMVELNAWAQSKQSNQASTSPRCLQVHPSTSKYFCTAIRCNWIISTVCCCWTTWPNMIPTTYQNVLRCLAFQRPTVNIVPKRQTETFASHLLCDRYHKNHNSFHQFSNCLEPSCAKSHSSTSSSPSLIVAGDARV